jgi:hypothetical protein
MPPRATGCRHCNRTARDSSTSNIDSHPNVNHKSTSTQHGDRNLDIGRSQLIERLRFQCNPQPATFHPGAGHFISHSFALTRYANISGSKF